MLPSSSIASRPTSSSSELRSLEAGAGDSKWSSRHFKTQSTSGSSAATNNENEPSGLEVVGVSEQRGVDGAETLSKKMSSSSSSPSLSVRREMRAIRWKWTSVRCVLIVESEHKCEMCVNMWKWTRREMCVNSWKWTRREMPDNEVTSIWN